MRDGDAAVALAAPRRHGRVGALTTPAGLRVATVALVVGVLVVGTVAPCGARTARTPPTRSASTATPLLLDAEDLYVALADADAAARRRSCAPATSRRRSGRYLEDIDWPGAASSRSPPSRALRRRPRRRIDARRPAPALHRLVEAARANSRLDYPVGAAYLRQASDLMSDEMLPAADDDLRGRRPRRLDRGYRAGTSACRRRC